MVNALGTGNGSFFGWNFPPRNNRRKQRTSNSANGGDGSGNVNGNGKFNFPLKQAAIAASLALTGDTIAQVSSRWKTDDENKDNIKNLLANHDWLRSLRMASYGFLLYGPGSYAWYQYLDHSLPKQSVQNVIIKVILNQLVLGPCVIAVVFAWNNLWKGQLSELPGKYKKDALPTLLYGFNFWIPVSILNFWAVPLQTRVAFMSTCAIFWNFYLSSTMSK